jgi:hypothetical protein
LLRISTGTQYSLQNIYSENDWNGVYAIAEKQSIVGILLSALEIIHKNNNNSMPSSMLLLQWIGMANDIENNTNSLIEAGKTVISYFRENGFSCQILKGSSVGRYYLNPARRTSGDIDVWVDGGRKKIYDFARTFDKDGKLYGVNYHHIHFHLLDGVHIEVHIWPSFLSSPLRNWRLHKFCNLHRPTMDADAPSLAFNRVFILLHCYRHICGHGVGLRQIMDYFYVLQQGFTEEERKDAVYWIGQLGMKRFACGLMWVLQEFFGLEQQYLLMPSDEKEGRFIIKEVMQTGNMGHGDTREWGSMKTPLSRFFLNLRRDFYMAKHYPHEAIWQPFFSIWLYFWRLSKGLLGSEDNDN